MEDEFDEDNQISGEEGDLIIFDLVTYGYGEEIGLDDLLRRAGDVGSWCKANALDYRISVTANHW